MKEALRNIWRRKARSALTIFGVAIGIFALVTIGSLANSLNSQVQSFLDYYTSRVIVTAAAGGSAGNAGFLAQGAQVPVSLGDRLKLIDGVDRAYPTITLAVDQDQIASFSSPPLIFAYKPSDVAGDPKKLKLQRGRDLQDGDTGKVIVGSSIVQDKKVKVGDKVRLNDREFEVIGMLERTNGVPDYYYVMNLPDAQVIIKNSSVFNPDSANYVTDFNVIPKAGTDPDALAKTIQTKISGVHAVPPNDLKKQVEQSTAVFNLIILGSALIALIVGSLSVINTMIMSVSERQKEIGIKRVVGAKTRHILKEIMTETGLIGLLGGLLGLAGGAALVSVINFYTAKTGLMLFNLTPELALAAVAFAFLLGMVAGVYPAFRAARVKPIDVLRGD